MYISLGGNRVGKLKTLRNLGIVFLLTGIWHGAAWNFVVWGLWHGLFIILEKALNIKEFEEKHPQWWIKTIQHFYCIFIFVIGWVMFRADNMKYAWDYLMNMFGLLHLRPDDFIYTLAYYIDTIEVVTFVAAILCSIPLFKNILEIENKIVKAFINMWLLILFFLSTVTIASSTYNPFIYFRF